MDIALNVLIIIILGVVTALLVMQTRDLGKMVKALKDNKAEHEAIADNQVALYEALVPKEIQPVSNGHEPEPPPVAVEPKKKERTPEEKKAWSEKMKAARAAKKAKSTGEVTA